MTKKAKFGFLLPMGSYRTCLSAALMAERLQLDSAWIYDDLHGFPHGGSLEPLTAWSMMAQATRRISLGSCVIAIQRHHPVTLSRALSTIDLISGGRTICGIGAGGSEADYGFPAVSQPVRRMVEAIDVMRSLWEGDKTDYAGSYYKIKGAHLTPKPLQRPHPPIWLAANSPRTLRLTAEIADGWLPMVTTPRLFQEDIVNIRELADKAGRRGDSIRTGLLIYMLAGKDPSAVRESFEPLARPTALWVNGRSLRRLGHTVPQSPNDVPTEVLRQMTAYGTPQDVAQSLGAFADAGVEHFALASLPPERTEEQMSIFFEDILPLL